MLFILELVCLPHSLFLSWPALFIAHASSRILYMLKDTNFSQTHASNVKLGSFSDTLNIKHLSSTYNIPSDILMEWDNFWSTIRTFFRLQNMASLSRKPFASRLSIAFILHRIQTTIPPTATAATTITRRRRRRTTITTGWTTWLIEYGLQSTKPSKDYSKNPCPWEIHTISNSAAEVWVATRP